MNRIKVETKQIPYASGEQRRVIVWLNGQAAALTKEQAAQLHIDLQTAVVEARADRDWETKNG